MAPLDAVYENKISISKIKKISKYGSLLDYKYFIWTNFDTLKKKVIEIDLEKGQSIEENRMKGKSNDKNKDKEEKE